MANKSANDICDRALSRIGEVGIVYPGARAFMYERVGHRQRQLYVLAARANPDRYGACATSALTAGVCDLNDIVAPVPTPEMIQKVEVLLPGASPYAAGDEISIVSVYDAGAELAPRAYVRDGVLIGVGSDLALVTSIKLFFSRLPDLFTVADAGKLVELEAPWDTLLDLDLSIWIAEKATQVAAATRALALDSFHAEEKRLLGEWEEHVRNYTPIVSRFAPPRDATRPV